MIQPLIPSRSNISLARVLYFLSSSTTSFPLPRSCGRSLSSLNLLLFYLNSSCFSGQGKQRQSRRTTWPRLVSIGPFTFPIGYTGTQVSPLIEYTNSYPSSCVAHFSYFSEGTIDPIAVTAGLVQTGLYVDFFYVYFTKYVSVSLSITPVVMIHSIRVLQGQKFELPAWKIYFCILVSLVLEKYHFEVSNTNSVWKWDLIIHVNSINDKQQMTRGLDVIDW